MGIYYMAPLLGPVSMPHLTGVWSSFLFYLNVGDWAHYRWRINQCPWLAIDFLVLMHCFRDELVVVPPFFP